MLQDAFTARTSRGHAIKAHVVFRERDWQYVVRLYVNGRPHGRPFATRWLATARGVARDRIRVLSERLEAAPDRRRPFDARRRTTAYLVDATPAVPVAGFRRVRRVYRCVICGARAVAACDAGERCPFWKPKLVGPRRGSGPS